MGGPQGTGITGTEPEASRDSARCTQPKGFGGILLGYHPASDFGYDSVINPPKGLTLQIEIAPYNQFVLMRVLNSNQTVN